MWGFPGINAETQYLLSSILANLHAGNISLPSDLTPEPYMYRHDFIGGLGRLMIWFWLDLFCSDLFLQTLGGGPISVGLLLELHSQSTLSSWSWKAMPATTNEQDSCLTVLCACTALHCIALHQPECYPIARGARARLIGIRLSVGAIKKSILYNVYNIHL